MIATVNFIINFLLLVIASMSEDFRWSRKICLLCYYIALAHIYKAAIGIDYSTKIIEYNLQFYGDTAHAKTINNLCCTCSHCNYINYPL